MARAANSTTDFVITVDGIGVFTFAKKKFRDQIAIECEYSRLTEGVATVTDFLDLVATAVSNIKVLAVQVPDGWVIDDLDPEESESYAKLMKVWSALRDKQLSFRAGNAPAVEGEGSGTVALG